MVMKDRFMKDRVIKHLEMLQGVINRLGHNSFLIKGWSLTIIAAGIIFLGLSTSPPKCIILIFSIPIIGLDYRQLLSLARTTI